MGIFSGLPLAPFHRVTNAPGKVARVLGDGVQAGALKSAPQQIKMRAVGNHQVVGLFMRPPFSVARIPRVNPFPREITRDLSVAHTFPSLHGRLVAGGAILKHAAHPDWVSYLPCVKGLVKLATRGEHSSHILHTADVPLCQGLVKGVARREHTFHIPHLTYVPAC